MRGHCYDALVGIAGCDKSLPGMMMAMLRLNVPSVFLYGGSIMPGRFKGRDVTVVDIFEGVGQFAAGKMPAERSRTISNAMPAPARALAAASSRPTPWPASPKRSGLALPYSSGPPAEVLARDDFALKAGQAVMAAGRKASASARHLHAQSLRECRRGGGGDRRLDQCRAASAGDGERSGIKFDLFDVAEIFKRTPYLASLKPGGQYVAKDMWEAGGVPMLMRALLDGGYHRRLVHDRHRQNRRGKSERRELQSEPESDDGAVATRWRRPAAWWASKAISRPKAPS